MCQVLPAHAGVQAGGAAGLGPGDGGGVVGGDGGHVVSVTRWINWQRHGHRTDGLDRLVTFHGTRVIPKVKIDA